jgi:transketolase
VQETVTGLNTTAGPPHVLIARTTFGKGVSYMEGQIKWHYWPMSDTEYRQAVQEVEAMP